MMDEEKGPWKELFLCLNESKVVWDNIYCELELYKNKLN